MMARFFADLRKEVAVEAGVSTARGIGHVHVGNAASGGLIDAAAIALDPGEMAQIFFTLDRNDRDVAGIFAVRICADFENDLLPGGLFEEAVDVVGGVQIAAVHREDVISGFDVDARLS